jgi:hypothetical protein
MLIVLTFASALEGDQRNRKRMLRKALCAADTKVNGHFH